MRNSSGLEGWGCFGVIVAAIVAIVAGAVAKGWALATMWGWFVVPYFDVAQMTIPQAIGIGMIVSLLTYQQNTSSSDSRKSKDTSTALVEVMVTAIISPLISVLFAWIVLQFM